jgi:hypothetical protein
MTMPSGPLWLVVAFINGSAAPMHGRTAMQRNLTLAFALALTAGAPAIAASYSQRPVAATTQPHHKPQWIEISSFSFGVSRQINAPTHDASDREGTMPTISQIKVHEPKFKRR